MVYRFLVTGTSHQLNQFNERVALRLNATQQRGQTILYTCIERDREFALQMARKGGVTLQELHLSPEGEESYELLVGSGPGWRPHESGLMEALKMRRQMDPDAPDAIVVERAETNGKTRAEHLQWCKDRALEYIELGDVVNAWASMCSDLDKHPETSGHIGISLGMAQLIGRQLDTPEQMRKFIEGFN